MQDSPHNTAQDTQPVPPDQTRRRVLAGSLAAPMVMTVSSAAATTRTTFTACLDNARLQPLPNQIMAGGISEPDEWLRVQVNIYEVGFFDKNGQLKIKPGRYFIGPDKVTFHKLNDVDAGRNAAVPVRRFNANTPGLHKRVTAKQYALAYANSEGEIVGFGWEQNGGAHCKKSCFASVIARAKA